VKPERQRLLTNGLLTGAIGYAVIVAFFAAVNILQGHSPLFTAAVLGNALLGEPSTSIAAAPVAVYNGLHLVVFLVLGMSAAWIAGLVERRPQLWYLLLFLGVFAFFHLFGAVAMLAAPAGNSVSLSLVLVASLLAVAGMSTWLWRAYPGLVKGVRAVGDFEDPLPASGREPKRS
jgi:hypothetical protein